MAQEARDIRGAIKAPFMLPLFLLWVSATVLGLSQLWAYEFEPGSPASAPASYPLSAPLKLSKERPTLVVLLHPRCPCSSASLEELAKLMARCPEKVLAYAVFYRPKNSSSDWEETSLIRSARMIPNLQVTDDPDGQIAKLFGGLTSGTVLLYRQDGTLSFNGGITSSRGHCGDNRGRSALRQQILSEIGNSESKTTSVFGCELLDEGS